MSEFHLNHFEVIHYRGIDGLSIPKLARANLITGANGIGKSALLEAMWIFSGRYNTSRLLWNASLQRNSSPVLNPLAALAADGVLEVCGSHGDESHSIKAWFELFADNQSESQSSKDFQREGPLYGSPVIGQLHTELDGNSADQNDNNLHRLQTNWGVVLYPKFEPAVPLPNCVLMGSQQRNVENSEVLERFSNLVRQKYKRNFLKVMNLGLPKVQDIEIQTNGVGISYLSAVTKDELSLPIQDLGGGITQLALWFLNLFDSRDGVFFSDEMEKDLHYSVISEVWNYGRKWMDEWNVQLVATTHSDECIQAAIAAFEDNLEDLAVHELFRVDGSGDVSVATYTGDALVGARNLNMELR